jgi:hypothetical protein
MWCLSDAIDDGEGDFNHGDHPGAMLIFSVSRARFRTCGVKVLLNAVTDAHGQAMSVPAGQARTTSCESRPLMARSIAAGFSFPDTPPVWTRLVQHRIFKNERQTQIHKLILTQP